jgi:hypothetical protein
MSATYRGLTHECTDPDCHVPAFVTTLAHKDDEDDTGATLVIGTYSSRCSACGGNADPAETHHTMRVMRGTGCGAEFTERVHTYARVMSGAIDAVHLQRQKEWSSETFGPGVRPGVVEHIRKELVEVEESDYCDLGEWVDVIILALDGAWRMGAEPQQIIDAIKAKQARNEARSWPDWRTASADHAIEHVRSGDAS